MATGVQPRPLRYRGRRNRRGRNRLKALRLLEARMFPLEVPRVEDVVARLKQRLRAPLGDWFLDAEMGLPWPPPRPRLVYRDGGR